MTDREYYEQWFEATYGQRAMPQTAPMHDFCYAGFKAGAASRDAEIARLKNVPMRYRRMAFNAQLQDEVAELAKERDQLRAQINVLREALELIALDDCCTNFAAVAATALSPTPEQSLAEYRNKVIEECATRCDPKEEFAYSRNYLSGITECAEAIRAMKDQP